MFYEELLILVTINQVSRNVQHGLELNSTNFDMNFAVTCDLSSLRILASGAVVNTFAAGIVTVLYTVGILCLW